MENKLDFPLYHGTSSMFLKSIIEHGLGGINLVEEWNIIELFKEIRYFGDQHLISIEEWQDERWKVSEIIEQNNTFKHGSVFLSPVKGVASRYASRKYGSEIISEFFELLEFIKKAGYNYKDIFKEDISPIFEIINKQFSPVVLKIENLSIDYLQSGEYGEDIYQQVEKMVNWKAENPEKSFDDYSKKSNFLVSKTIPFQLITIV